MCVCVCVCVCTGSHHIFRHLYVTQRLVEPSFVILGELFLRLQSQKVSQTSTT